MGEGARQGRRLAAAGRAKREERATRDGSHAATERCSGTVFSLDVGRVPPYALDMSETSQCDNRETCRAVCFDRRDYAGPVRRVAIACIDLIGVAALCLAVLFVIAFVSVLAYHEDHLPPSTLLLLLLVTLFYFTVLKRSRIRTLGYILTGVRIVNIEGRRPSLLQMTIRMLPLPLLPLTLPFDFGWVMDEPQRQTLRDKWAGTFVVRRNAQPIGSAPVRYKRIAFAGVFLIFPELGRVEPTIQSSTRTTLPRQAATEESA